MKQSFGQKGAGGRFLALALALIMLCSVLVPAYAAAVDDQGVAEQNEPAVTGSITYIFHAGETVQEVKVASGEALTKPTDPNAPEGEVFKGWFVDNDLNKPFTFGTTVSTHADEAVHLYAHFETAVAASTEQQPVAPEQPAAPGTSEEPKQPETNTPTDGGEENKGEQGSTENNENQTGENQNTENNGENTGDTTTPSDPTTPTDPVTPVEPIVPAEPQPAEALPAEENPEGEQIIYTTDAQTVEELYDRLIAAASLEEMNLLLENLTEAQKELLNQFDEIQEAALEAKMNEFGAYDIGTLQDRGTVNVQPNNSVSISVGRHILGARITEGDVSGISVRTDTYGYIIGVGPNVMPGDYTIKVSYNRYSDSYPHSQTIEDKIIVHVYSTDKTSAAVYYLFNPLNDPNTNDTAAWSAKYGDGTVNTTGAIWESGYNYDGNGKRQELKDKNVMNPKDYVVTMPDGNGLLADGSWLLPDDRDKDETNSAYRKIFKEYQTKLNNDYGYNLKLEDINAIYLIPYKISKNNGNVDPVHIDCLVSVKVDNIYLAKFWVTKPDGERKLVETQVIPKDESVKNATKAPTPTANSEYAEELVVDGITYVFDGWYRNDLTYSSENKLSYKNENDEWPYKPKEDDLQNGTIDFYARYIPRMASLTVKKEIGGNLITPGSSFTFTYTVKDENNDDVLPAEGESYTFTLSTKNNYTHTIDNLPVGGTIKLTETNASGYHTWYQNGVDTFDSTKQTDDNESTDKTHTITLVSGENKVVCYNEKHIIPDTGLTLDSWPYLLALCFVTVGAVVTLARGRRSDVD